ncbi:MAG: hypothetical protein QM706_14315 [Nitrospira sp.]
MKHFALWMTMGVMSALVSFGTPAHATVVTQLEFTKGAVNYDGKYNEIIDRLLAQDGTLKLGQFQAIGDLVPAIEGCKTFSLFTSGFSGASAPTAEVTGSSIKVDLSSLFFGAGSGDSHRLLNIGGLATGLFNQDTREFFLSWDHVFEGGKHEGQATFFLSGIAKFDTLPTPVPAAVVLFATGLVALGAWAYQSNRTNTPLAG